MKVTTLSTALLYFSSAQHYLVTLQHAYITTIKTAKRDESYLISIFLFIALASNEEC